MPQPDNVILILVRLDRTTGESQHAIIERSDMTSPYWKYLGFAATVAVPSLVVHADTSNDDLSLLREQLRQQQQVIEQQQQRLSLLEQSADTTWLNERQSEEIKALVRDILADADTRASLLQDSVTAGYNKGFFINAPDDTFYLRVNPEFQIRYIHNTRDGEAPGADEDESGFQVRRAMLDIRGHALDPALTYRLRLGADRGDGGIKLEYAYIGYDIVDGLNIRLGQFKPLFAREEAVSALRQLAVERSYAADYFTVDYTQGAELSYDGAKNWRAALAIHDGSYAANSEFNADRTNFAISGRAEWLLAGDWKQFDDFTSWSTDEFGLLLGLGGGYEVGEEGSGTSTPDLYKLTADLSAEFGGVNLFVGGYLQKFSDNGDAALPTNLDDATQLGLVAQAGAFVVPDKVELFGRYEWIDFDGVYYRNSGTGTQGGTGDLAHDDLRLITVGANWYLRKHNAKATVDLVWALDPVPASNSGSGLLNSADDNQIALRAQWQFAF